MSKETALKDYVKDFMRMDRSSTMYDSEIDVHIASAKRTLDIAGVEAIRGPLVDNYIATFVRNRMLLDASQAFKESETEREKEVLSLLVFGGDTPYA